MIRDESATRAMEILLVEDSPSDRMLAVAALQQGKVRNAVHTAANGIEALSFLRREGPHAQAPRPDLILLDLNMPRMDGRELLRHVKMDPVLRRIPVVVLTTSAAPEDITDAYSAHANSYITKPVAFDRFAEVLSVVESYWFDAVTLAAVRGDEALYEATALTARPVVPAAGRRLTVLLTEDSPTDALLVRAALGAAGDAAFHVIHVTRVGDAIAELERTAVDVILTDLGLPDVEGFDAVRRLRSAAPWLPLVVLTGSDGGTGDEAIALGAEDYVGKDELHGTSLARALRFAVLRSETRTERHRIQRVETVGRLSAGVAHDFNNVLTAIGGTAELLHDNEGAEDRDALLAEMRASVDRGRALTGQLLSFSRRNRFDPSPLSCNTVVTESSQLLRRLLRSDIAVDVQLADDLPEVRADRHQLEQVIVNLGVNAGEAMPEGGTIRITTGRSSETPAGADDATSKRPLVPAVEIRVSDTGPGIPDELHETIFEAFFTTKSEGMGTGLGLATVREIAQRHGGEVRYEAVPGGGACFIVSLPPATPSPGSVADVPPATAPTTPGISSGDNRTILVVEDEPAVLKPIVRILGRAGYQVLTAASADEAWLVWQDASARIDLVLSDLVMPGTLHAVDLAVRVTTARPDVPVVFCSGYAASFQDSRVVMREGENFVAKPFLADDLLRTIAQALERVSAARARNT